MSFQISYLNFFFVLFLIQSSYGYRNVSEKNQVLALQEKVEHFIERILVVVREYYHQIKSEFKCIPDEVPNDIMEALKKSIDCVDTNEKKFQASSQRLKAHQKQFLWCFTEAKKEVERIMDSINSTVDHCPSKMTEKTYQINVTTSYTKIFNINIKNGLEISKKILHASGKDFISCDYADSNEDELEEDDYENKTENEDSDFEDNKSYLLDEVEGPRDINHPIKTKYGSSNNDTNGKNVKKKTTNKSKDKVENTKILGKKEKDGNENVNYKLFYSDEDVEDDNDYNEPVKKDEGGSKNRESAKYKNNNRKENGDNKSIYSEEDVEDDSDYNQPVKKNNNSAINNSNGKNIRENTKNKSKEKEKNIEKTKDKEQKLKNENKTKLSEEHWKKQRSLPTSSFTQNVPDFLAKYLSS